MVLSDKLDRYLTRVMESSYDNLVLICNPVVARNPFAGSLLLRIAKQQPEEDKKTLLTTVAVKLAKYYIKILFHFFMYCVNYVSFKISKLRAQRNRIDRKRDLIVVSTFTMIDRILHKQRFDEVNFGSLYSIMEKEGQQFVILCMLFGSKHWNMRSLIKTYNILANDPRNFITEFELLQWRDWVSLFLLCLSYPLAVLKMARGEYGEYDIPFRQEVIHTLDQSQVHNLVRYYLGKRLKRLSDAHIKLIAWYENQVIDMLLYRGIHDAGANIESIGCQFYLTYPLYTNLHPLPVEREFGLLPNVILVNGPYYLSDKKALNTRVGISPRYNYLFNFQSKKDHRKDSDRLLVLLPYEISQAETLIEMMKQFQIRSPSNAITIKPHPNHQLSPPYVIPESWEQTTEDLSLLCSSHSIAITSGSGTALEATVMGCPVVIVGNTNGLTFNPMPEYGRDHIWDIVFDVDELKRSIENLIGYRDENPDQIVTMANELRNMFFTRATEQRYKEVFYL
jgi:hypothetical protein